MPMGRKLTVLTALAFEVTVWVAVIGFMLWAMIQGSENVAVTVSYK